MPALPHSPNLRHLRRQARELQRRSGSTLAECQLDLAKTYGFGSWAELKHEVELIGEAAAVAARYTGTPNHAIDDLRGVVDTATLVAGLRHPNPRARYDCLGLLDHLADDSCLEPMVAATADPVPRVRRMAVHALGCRRCKPEMLCDDLVAVFAPLALADPAWRVRMEAVISIVQQPPSDRTREVLARVAERDTHERVRDKAAWALRLHNGGRRSYGIRAPE
jgi:HEAT repeat protein